MGRLCVVRGGTRIQKIPHTLAAVYTTSLRDTHQMAIVVVIMPGRSR